MYAVVNGDLCELRLPKPDDQVLPGIPWGAFDELTTPAYWRSQAWQVAATGALGNFRLGRSLIEETAACLLGGYGMPAELGLAAYDRLRERGLLAGLPGPATLEAVLSEPLRIGAACRAYRFPRQKARYLAACLSRLKQFIEPASDVALRDLLATLPGVGLKTASWIVRNYRGSDAVAVIDIHILRAGRHIGLFDANWTPQACYRKLEQAFLCFANAIETRASLLDSIMWDQMRRMPSRTSHAH